jgi:hypothetical protein
LNIPIASEGAISLFLPSPVPKIKVANYCFSGSVHLRQN